MRTRNRQEKLVKGIEAITGDIEDTSTAVQASIIDAWLNPDNIPDTSPLDLDSWLQAELDAMEQTAHEQGTFMDMGIIEPWVGNKAGKELNYREGVASPIA